MTFIAAVQWRWNVTRWVGVSPPITDTARIYLNKVQLCAKLQTFKTNTH